MFVGRRFVDSEKAVRLRVEDDVMQANAELSALRDDTIVQVGSSHICHACCWPSHCRDLDPLVFRMACYWLLLLTAAISGLAGHACGWLLLTSYQTCLFHAHSLHAMRTLNILPRIPVVLPPHGFPPITTRHRTLQDRNT